MDVRDSGSQTVLPLLQVFDILLWKFILANSFELVSEILLL
jgi:hypothetical protein